MWNNLFSAYQEPGYKRLAIALCISVVIHFFLAGKFYKLLPENKPELHTIEARLQPPPKPKVVAKDIEPAKPAEPIPKEAPPKPTKKKTEKPPKKIDPVELPPENVLTPSDNVAVLEPQIEPISQPPEPVPEPTAVPPDEVAPTPNLAEEQLKAEDESIVINEKAYQYVQTTFNVSTKIGGSPDGKATMVYEMHGGDYQITSIAKANGLAALVLSELFQSSEGLLTKTGLQPNKFTYNYGNKASKSRLATFDWQAKTVKMETAAGAQTEPLPEAAQDLLSFMYQFMYVPPLHKMQIPIVNGKSLRTYDYSFEGEVSIPLPMGEVNTIHIQHSNVENDEKIELWLAVDYQYLPVKILKIDKKGKIYEFTASRINTERPLANASNKVDTDNQNAPASP